MPAILGSDGPPVECIASLDECSLKRLAGEHLAKLNALDLGRHDRIVDKLPDNYLYIGLLAAMFPKAVFIHCRRDPRDVAVSCWMSDFRSIRWANDTDELASRIRQYHRLVEHWKRVFPLPLLTVEYADVVSDVDAAARRLLDACQLEWDPACLEFYRSKRVVRTASVVQVRQPIYTSSLERWRHYQHDLGDLFAVIAANDTISSRTCTAL
jgi:Sulfotransferase family